MKAMLLNKLGSFAQNSTPLECAQLPIPTFAEHELRIQVSVCGVCHTELDEIEGRTPPKQLPVVPGHQVVGRVEAMGDYVSRFKINDRVGVAWIYSACGTCGYCVSGRENLCTAFQATGRDAHGGYAEYMVVSEHYAYPIPNFFSDASAAPLLCAGAIGYRSLRLTGVENGQRLGLTGFGASGHLVLKMAKFQYPDSKIFVFARNAQEREFALHLGAAWSGDTRDIAPEQLDCIIDTTPAWGPVLEALANLKAGGRLVINAIRKQDDNCSLLCLDYPQHLWLEKEIKSVANITRADVSEFLQLAAAMRIQPEVQVFDLEQTNQSLSELKNGQIRGAKVLQIK